MKNSSFLFMVLFVNILGYSQIDTAKVMADTLAISNKQKQLTEIANQLIDSSIFKKSVDSLQRVKKAFETDLAQLEQAIIKNEKAINTKRKEITKITEEVSQLLDKLNEFRSKIKEANDDYDSLKSNIVKMQQDSATLANQAAKIKEKSDSLAEKANNAQTELNRLLAEISKKEDSLEAIAVIKLKGQAIALSGTVSEFNTSDKLKLLLSSYSLQSVFFGEIKNEVTSISPKLKLDTVKIRKVHIYVKEGRIVEIIVKTDYGIFRNTKSQIDLVHFSERRYSDKLFKDDEDKNASVRTFIYPGDAIIYEPIRSYGDIPYSEFEITLTPDSSNNQYIIRENTSINTYFEVAAFTDIKGIAGDPNGLAQITGSAKFITSTRNFRNTSLMAFQYIGFNGGLSKFDNDFKGTFISANDSINRKDLFQRSQYAVGVKINLLHWVRSPYPKLLVQDIQINSGFNFIGSRIADTLQKSNDTLFRTVTHNQFFIEPLISFARQKNFSMSIALPFFYQNLKASSGISNSKGEWWVCPSINLMYYSKRDSKSKIFFRYNHFVNIKDKKQAFNQLQLGFAANITNVIQGK